MKAWTARSKRDKATRIVATLIVIPWLGYGAVSFARDTYDYATAEGCKGALAREIDDTISDNMEAALTLPDPVVIAKTQAASARKHAAAIEAVRCPSSIAGAQSRAVTELREYADVKDAQAAGSAVSSQKATQEASEALMGLSALVK